VGCALLLFILSLLQECRCDCWDSSYQLHHIEAKEETVLRNGRITVEKKPWPLMIAELLGQPCRLHICENYEEGGNFHLVSKTDILSFPNYCGIYSTDGIMHAVQDV
jgi:hypothetical protein